MKTRKDLCAWIVEALKDLNGSAQIIKIREHIWQHHQRRPYKQREPSFYLA